MADKWETRVGQLRMVGGSPQPNAANLGVAERRPFFPTGQRGKGRLYVLVELSGGPFGREELCQDLVTAIVEAYFHTPGTVTYGLRQAILLANTQLVRANARVASEHRLGGMACVVLRGGDLFVGQAGWPIVCVVHDGQVQAFPDTMLEDDSGTADASILGQRQTTEVRLFHAAIRPGDTILIMDGPMSRKLGISRAGQVVSGPFEQAMHNLETLAPAEDCTAMLIRVGGTSAGAHAERWAFVPVERPEAQEKEPGVHRAAGVTYAPPAEEDVLPEEGEGFEDLETHAPELPPSPARWEGEETIEAGAASSRMPPSAGVAGDRESGLGSRDRFRSPPAHPSGSAPAGARAVGQEQKAARRPSARAAGPGVEKQVQGVLKGIGRGMRALGERMLPDRQGDRAATLRTQRRRRASRARRRHDQSAPETRWWTIAALAIPILVLISAGVYVAYRNWSQQALFDQKLETAQRKRDIALGSAESPTVARDYWLEVLALANEAKALQPDNPEVLQLRAQAETEIDRIDRVTRLGQAFKLYEYTAPGSAPGRAIVAGLDVYVLDRGAGRIYHHALNELRNALRDPNAEQMLLQQGQPIEGQNVGSLIDMAWMKEGGERQAGALLILDANGVLFEYDPTWEQFQAQMVGGQSAWRSPYALTTYDGNLYLLDPMANQVFKYWSQQYANEPVRWITQEGANLATTIDMGIDGSIYLLHNDGRVTKYYGGEPVSFVLTRMPQPLSSADTIYVDMEEVAQYIYVADSAQERIVQFDREGTFVRQLRPARGQETTLRQLTSIFVDEMGGKLYYVAGNALYVTDLPPVQR